MRISNRNVLVFGFAGGFALVAGLIILITVTVSGTSTLKLIYEKAENHIDTIVALLGKDFVPIQNQADGIREALMQGRMTIAEIEKALPVLVRHTAILDAIGLVTKEGEFKLYIKPWDQDMVGALDKPSEALDFVKSLEASDQSIWRSPLTLNELEGPTRIEFYTPLTVDGEYYGALFHVVTLSTLSGGLQSIVGNRAHTPFILNGPDLVLAHPFLATEVTVDSKSWLPVRGLVNDPVLARFDERIGLRAGDSFAEAVRNSNASRLKLDGQTHIILSRDLPVPGLDTVTVGVHFDADTETGTIEDVFESAMFAAVVVVITALLAWRVAVLMARPTKGLAEAARGVLDGNLDQVPDVPRSFLTELDEAAKAFNAMVQGLRESERVRALFGQVMPRAIAEEMIKTPGGLRPRQAEATVLFCDLEGFTNICEDIKPERIVGLLNAYFDAMVSVIEAHDGVVTQFQGDAILAVFGVPIEREDHADCAISAAREMIAVLRDRQFENLTLAGRIGINTGPLVAGNVGAESRMNYTVHGDAVNLSARLEQKNKELGTRILASQSVLDATKENLVKAGIATPSGTVSIRGRQQAVPVYDLSPGD